MGAKKLGLRTLCRSIAIHTESALRADDYGQGRKHGAEKDNAEQKKIMKVSSRFTVIGMTAAILLASVGAALAGLGQPSPWQMVFQDSVTPVMDDITSFNTFLFVITSAIAAFVLILLAVIIVRFNARALDALAHHRRPKSPRPWRHTNDEVVARLLHT